MHDELEPTQIGAKAWETPGNQRRVGAHPSDEDRQSLSPFGSDALARGAPEMLSEDYMCRQISGRPTLAESRSIGAKFEQQIAQLSALADVYRLAHMRMIQSGD